MFSFLVISGYGQVTHVSSTELINGDHYYALPKTAIVMDFTVKKTTYTKGKNFVTQFFTDAAHFDSTVFRVFGVDPKIYAHLQKEKVKEEFELGDVKISAAARRDKDKIFKIDGSRKFLRHNSMTFTYGDDGILLSGELSSEGQVFDAVVKGLSGIASIVGAAFRGPTASKTPAKPFTEDLENLEKLLDSYDDYLMNNTNANFEVYKDKKAIMTDRITAEFSRLFYKIKTRTSTVSIAYIPDAADSKVTTDQVIFKFDDSNGKLIINLDISNKVKVLTAYDYSTSSIKDGHTISITPDAEVLSGFFTSRKDSDKGFAYNVSVPSTVVYKSGKVKKDVQYFKIAQYGVVSYINPKQKKTAFELDPLTGDLKKITAETASITGDNVTSAATSATDVIKLIKGDDEKTKLQNKFDKLELKKKIKDLEDQGVQ